MKQLRVYAASVLLVLLMSLTAVAPKRAAGLDVGDKAIDFSLKNIDGKMVSMKDYNDAKGFILVFTCNHCPFAKAYEQRIIELHNIYAAKGYPVLAIQPNDPSIVPDDSFANMKKRAEEKGYPFVYLMDETQEVANTYGATKTPHVYVLSRKNSNLIVEYIGAIDNNYKDAAKANEHYVADAVNALLKGEPVKKTMTKAIGCTIKWKKS